MLDRDTLIHHLGLMGWTVKEKADSEWLSLHQTVEGEVRVRLTLDEHWLTATVVPFLKTRGNVTFELSRWLLRMYWDMGMTKFSYDSHGDAVMSTQMPVEKLDFVEVKTALEQLIEMTVAHRKTLREVAESA